MDEVIKIDTVDQYNKLFGLETPHLMVSVVDLSKAKKGRVTSVLIMAYMLFF